VDIAAAIIVDAFVLLIAEVVVGLFVGEAFSPNSTSSSWV
jgi:hypothetical protein